MEPDWWKTYFDRDYMDIHADRPYRNTEEEVNLLRSILGPAVGRRLLDASCGYGRHSIPLAGDGWRVVGFDQSEKLLSLAVENANVLVTEHRPKWVRGDLRTAVFSESFDAAISMFTSIGYCARESDNVAILESIHDSLAPGGVFVLDLANRDFLTQYPLALRNWWRRDKDFILEETKFDIATSVATTKNVLIRGDSMKESAFRVRLYSFHEIACYMNETGFEVQRVYGGYGAQPFTPTSHRMIVAARKNP